MIKMQHWMFINFNFFKILLDIIPLLAIASGKYISQNKVLSDYIESTVTIMGYSILTERLPYAIKYGRAYLTCYSITIQITLNQ